MLLLTLNLQPPATVPSSLGKFELFYADSEHSISFAETEHEISYADSEHSIDYSED